MVVVVVVLWLLNIFGVLGHLRDIRASNQMPLLGASIHSVASPTGIGMIPAFQTTA